MSDHKRSFKQLILLHLLFICAVSLIFLWVLPIFSLLLPILAGAVIYYLYQKEKHNHFGSNPYRPRR